MLLRVFSEEHEEQINHCQFTNLRRQVLLATCSNDKFLNVKVSDSVGAAKSLLKEQLRHKEMSMVESQSHLITAGF